MRLVRPLALVALVRILPAAAQTGEAPCAAVTTAALPPCDVPAAQASAAALGTVDGAPLAAADLDEELRKRIAGVDTAVADARRAALDREIADVLLHLEAERRHLSFRDFWESEVLRRTPSPSETDLKATFETQKKRYPDKTFEDLRPRIAGIVAAVNRGKREAELAESLTARYPVAKAADASAPGLAPDVVLATVGGRKITASSAATRLDAAGFAVRRDLYYAEQHAFETLARARLVKAEAGKRGVSPESLEKEADGIEDAHAVKFLGGMPAPPVLSIDVSGAPSRGPASAPVTVVEYADFECSHCAKTWTVVEEALKPYGDRVRYVFRNDPLPFHEYARKAAEAAAAAHEQGRFFELAGLMFRNQNALDAASLKKYAADAGCDTARFSAALDGARYAADVLLEARSGERYGVVGTPFFFVNGVWLRFEATDLKGIRAAIDAALAKAAGPR